MITTEIEQEAKARGILFQDVEASKDGKKWELGRLVGFDVQDPNFKYAVRVKAEASTVLSPEATIGWFKHIRNVDTKEEIQA